MNYRRQLPKDSSNNEYSMIPFQRRFSDFQNQFEDSDQFRGHNNQGNKFQYPSHHRMQARNFQFQNQFPIQSLNNFYNIYKRNLDSNIDYETSKPKSQNPFSLFQAQNRFPNIHERNSNIGYEMPNSNSFGNHNNKKPLNLNYNPEDIIEEPDSQDLKQKTKRVEITITIDSPSERRVEVKTENIQTERQTDKKEDSEAIDQGNDLNCTLTFE
jgi:hypothetical protein